MKTLFLLFLTLIVLALMPSCIEDSIDTSPSSQPEFSVDTLKMGVIFTDQPTPTHRFLVYNRHDKVMSISNISLRSGQKIFRMNADGFSGETFQNIEIRPNDSIFVFVEATVPPSGTPALTPTTDYIDFTTNGVTRSILLLAEAQDVERRHGLVITEDSRWDATYPYQIFDSLVVDHGVTLTLSEGTALHFHDKAYMRIYGSLVTEGTPQNPVNLSGDRTDNVVGDISFDLMASQWDRLEFAPESKGNRLSHTVIRNTSNGVIADSLSQVTFLNCRLRNSADYSLVSRYADVSLYAANSPRHPTVSSPSWVVNSRPIIAHLPTTTSSQVFVEHPSNSSISAPTATTNRECHISQPISPIRFSMATARIYPKATSPVPTFISTDACSKAPEMTMTTSSIPSGTPTRSITPYVTIIILITVCSLTPPPAE